MKDISLKDLLEAGCHFGHKAEKWHPKASSFIYGEREGIHIIDLAKTRDGLKNAAEFVKNLGREGKTLLIVATKRQAKGVITEAAKHVGTSYLTKRWIGGFLTNWDEVKKNIDKLNSLRRDKEEGMWNKYPKHEIIQLDKYLYKLESVYKGVVELLARPDAIFIVDIKKEVACLREATRLSIPILAIVDTNTNPNDVDYPIPGNDDAVGSIQFITNYIADAYLEGNQMRDKIEGKEEKPEEKVEKVEEVEKKEEVKEVKKVQKIETVKGAEPVKKKRGRPKKNDSSEAT